MINGMNRHLRLLEDGSIVIDNKYELVLDCSNSRCNRIDLYKYSPRSLMINDYDFDSDYIETLYIK